LPRNKLSFEGRELSWQEVVLSIFNPLLATQAMKQTLLTKNVLLNGAGKCATLFDELRQQYIGDRIQRHELSSTVVSRLRLKEEDRHIVEQLGITIEE
ncbi:MAG TPA: hypothetical protein VLH77_03150, partial [Gammaproteobacteria bacterium]|nr:hypothetical protein [Gammaproteobacteria bacterium]